MILPADLVPKFKAICPAYSQECASVLLQRGLIAEIDQKRAVEVISRFSGASEPAAAELAQQHLITPSNKAAVAEFMKRVVRRLLLNSNGLAADELSNILGVTRTVACHMAKGTRNLTADQTKLLIERLFLTSHAHAA
jgi:antitoxin component HigA of HigAB toxin-antitoxin module